MTYTDKDYHAHNLDALLDNLYDTLNEGYRKAIENPEGEEEETLSFLHWFARRHMVDGFVKVADKVRHNSEIKQ